MILLPHGSKIGKATVIVDIVSKGNPEIRPGIHMTPKGITDHDTGNVGRGANAKSHNRLIHNMASYKPKDTSHVCWHITVDEHFIIQHIPFNESAYHCGDGWGINSGNRTTLGVEKCMNVDGDRAQTEENAIALYAYLLPIFKWSPADINPHQKWSGKYCPAVILKRDGSFLPYRKRIESACTGKVVNEVATYLQKGDTGLQVTLLQQNLIKAGLDIKADGSYGPATENAVKAFQTSNNLAADGFYGPQTKVKLEELVKPKPAHLKLPTERYRLTTGTFESKDAAEKARKELKDRYGWLVYLKEV